MRIDTAVQRTADQRIHDPLQNAFPLDGPPSSQRGVRSPSAAAGQPVIKDRRGQATLLVKPA